MNGDLQITGFNNDNAAGNIFAAGPNIAGGTSNVLAVQSSPFRYVESISMNQGYPVEGTPLLFAVDEEGNTGNWEIQGTIHQAYTNFENNLPQGHCGNVSDFRKMGTLSVRAFYATRSGSGDYTVMSGPEVGGESRDFTCEGKP